MDSASPGAVEPGVVTTFSGPWASELESAYRSAKTSLQRRVLADGKITAGEEKALQDDFVSCMSQAGYPSITFGDRGAFTVENSGDPNVVGTIATRCEDTALGDADLLYWQMQQRPNNEPVAAAIAECLVRVKAVPVGYTAEQYQRDSEAGKPPFNPDDPLVGKCMADPLNAGR